MTSTARGGAPADLPIGQSLLTWAAAPGPRKVLAEARDKLERGYRGDKVVVARDLTAADRRDVGRLLSKAWEVSGKPVTLGLLRRAVVGHLPGPVQAPSDVSAGEGDGQAATDPLVWLLTTIGGPLRNRPAERAAAALANQQRLSDAVATLVDAGVPLDVVRAAVAGRWLGKVDDTLGDRTRRAATVWSALPVRPVPGDRPDGSQPGAAEASLTCRSRLLSELASTTLASPHDLDRDTDTGRLVARLLAAATRVLAGEDPAGTGPVTTTDEWRQAWGSADVLCDRVSSTVLVLNVPLAGSGAGAVLATAAAEAGEPCWLTARALEASFAASAGLHTVRVCENPAVMEAAADELGPACPALVCVYGRPSAAAWTLLRQLADDGVRLLVSTDRDRAGNQIAADLLALSGALEWCPDADGLFEEDRLPDLLADLLAAVR